MSILSEISKYAMIRVLKDKETMSLDRLKSLTENLPKGDFPFEEALRKPEISLICEIKKASPSKGVIDPEFNYLKIAKEYEKGKADAISCLTEPKWFLGSDEIFKDIRKKVSLPMLRKDFVVDEYQIYQAKRMGANCILLIVSLLNKETLEKYINLADSLGLSALVETHDEEEIKTAISAGAKILGVNNRNLKDFSVDLNNAKRLRELIPENVIYVAESGIASLSDAKMLKEAGADALLIGEFLMRSDDKALLIKKIKGAAK
ncbi:MAG: indole-3-glycerol phosphate synthase TrpC [Lachnospiraceae bacterium]|nr:indole-3-glycerol phosphate synthase TrpC [Lachnospiraceae bacterium]